jgi:hypothetical protein
VFSQLSKPLLIVFCWLQTLGNHVAAGAEVVAAETARMRLFTTSTGNLFYNPNNNAQALGRWWSVCHNVGSPDNLSNTHFRVVA